MREKKYFFPFFFPFAEAEYISTMKSSSKDSPVEEMDPNDLDAFLQEDLALESDDEDDSIFLSLTDSLSLSRWLLDDVFSSVLFSRTFILFFIIPLFFFLPWYANTDEASMAPEKLIASCVPDETSGEVNNPICIDGKTAHKILWYCCSWPPLIFFILSYSYITIVSVMKKNQWYHDLLW